MSSVDVVPDDTLATRVAVLEALVTRLGGVTPQPQANPPVVIGPFDNVPAPGSPIRSDWPQDISTVVTEQGIPNDFFGVSHPWGVTRVTAQTTVVTTNSNGDFQVTFAQPFAATPSVVCNLSDPGMGPNLLLFLRQENLAPAFFYGHISNADGSNFVGNVRVNYQAWGRRT